MKLNFDILKDNSRFVLLALVVLSAFVGLGCIAASDNNIDSATGIVADISNPGIILDGDNCFQMTVPYNSGTGFHWEVSPETHGVELVSEEYVADHPDMCGTSGTGYFSFHVVSDDYYVKLVLISPSGEVVDSVDSNMIN